MQVVRNRKRGGRKNAKKEQKSNGRWALVRRGVFFTLIAGLLGFFIYNNIDYFVSLGEKHVPWMRPDARAETQPRSPAKPQEYRSVEEILGGPEFADDSWRDMEAVPLNSWLDETRVDAGPAETRPAEADIAPAPLPGLRTADLQTPVKEPKPDTQAANANAPRPLAMSPELLTPPEPQRQAIKPKPQPKPPVKKSVPREWLSSMQLPKWMASITPASLTSMKPQNALPKPSGPQSADDSTGKRTGAADSAVGARADGTAGQSIDKKTDQSADKKNGLSGDNKSSQSVDTETGGQADSRTAETEPPPVEKPPPARRPEWLPSISWSSWESLTSFITKKTPRDMSETPQVTDDSAGYADAAAPAAGKRADMAADRPVDKKADQSVDRKTSPPADDKSSRSVDANAGGMPDSQTVETDSALAGKPSPITDWLSSIQWPQWLSWSTLASLMPRKSPPDTTARIADGGAVNGTGAADSMAATRVGEMADQPVDKKPIPPVDAKTNRLADTKAGKHDTAAAGQSIVKKTGQPVDNNASPLVETKANQSADTKAAKHAAPDANRNSIFLSDIRCKLANRDDLNISMSIELSFDDNGALGDELHFKRSTLTVVASDVVRRYEYRDVEIPAISADLLSSFNGQLKEGRLNSVDIRDFRVEQVAVR